MSCSRCCAIFEISITSRTVGHPPGQKMRIATTSATFQTNNAKLYVPVVTLSTGGSTKFLENIKQGCKLRISWNKYGSVITTQPKKQ